MPLIGIIAKKRDIQAIKKELKESDYKIIDITQKAIRNIKNIVFEKVIFLEDINLELEEYKYMSEIIAKAKYLIINGDIDIKILKEIKIDKPVKIITFGFNTKSTIAISSVKDEKIIVCLQRDIEKINGDIIEIQEKEIKMRKQSPKKIYNNLSIFIIRELHNL